MDPTVHDAMTVLEASKAQARSRPTRAPRRFVSAAALTSEGDRWAARMLNRWTRLTMDADERLLRDGSDLADLERRQRFPDRGHVPGGCEGSLTWN